MSIAYAAPFETSDPGVIQANRNSPPTSSRPSTKKTVKNRASSSSSSSSNPTMESSQLLNEIGHSKVQQMYNLIYNTATGGSAAATVEDSSSDLADYKPLGDSGDRNVSSIKENRGASPMEFPVSSNMMFHEGFIGDSASSEEVTAGSKNVSPSNKDLVANKFADATKGYNLPYYASSVGDRRLPNAAAAAANAGPNNELMNKMNYMIKLLEAQKAEKTDNVTEELVLYVFLGVFVIFTVDSFSKIGKYVR